MHINKNKRPAPQFFHANPNDPIDVICATAGNMLIGHGLDYFSNEVKKALLGKRPPTPEERQRDALYRIEIEKREAEKRKSQNQDLIAAERLRLLKSKTDCQESDPKETAKQSSGVSIERTELDLHVKTEVISGCLPVVANSGGLVVAGEEHEAYVEWLKRLPGMVVLLLGMRGSGKTATALRLAEYGQAVFGLPVYWLGVPRAAQALLPDWIRIVSSLEQCPNDCIIIIDETGLKFLSLKFASKENLKLREDLMLCRQRNQTIIACAQSSRDIDDSIVRQSSCTIFKQPTMFADKNERKEIRPQAARAMEIYKQIPKEKRVSVACVFADDFQSPVEVSLPSFWSEALSNIYGTSKNTLSGGPKGSELTGRATNMDATRVASVEVTDKQIIDLRQQGLGYERIAKTLHCSVYRVRQCLAGQNDKPE